MVLQSTLFACLLNGAAEHIVRMCIYLRAGCARNKTAHKNNALYVCVFDAFAMMRSQFCGAIAIVLVIVLMVIVE